MQKRLSNKLSNHSSKNEDNNNNIKQTNSTNVDFDKLISIMPYQETTEDQKKRRILLKKLDKRQTGSLNFKQLVKIKRFLKFSDLPFADSAIYLAFQHVTQQKPSKVFMGKIDEIGLLRVFYCLKQYFEYYIEIFGKNNFQENPQINEQDIQKVFPLVQQYNKQIESAENLKENLTRTKDLENLRFEDLAQWSFISSLQSLQINEDALNNSQVINEEDENLEQTQVIQYLGNEAELESEEDQEEWEKEFDDIFTDLNDNQNQFVQNQDEYRKIVQEYLEKTGIKKGFEIIFAEILTKKLKDYEVYEYTIKRLRDFSKETHIFKQDYNQYIRYQGSSQKSQEQFKGASFQKPHTVSVINPND